MDPDGSRTAFELSVVHQRKDSSRVTSVAVDTDGERLYVGLDVGMLEEYKLVYVQGGVVARVSARRSISKKGIKGLCHIGGVDSLGILIEDGSLLLCDTDHLDPKPIPGLKNVIGMAADSRGTSPCGLAVAVRLSSKKHRIDLFEVSKGGALSVRLIMQQTLQEEVKDVTWINGQILVCTRQWYKSINANGVWDLLKPSSTPMCAAIPAAGVVAMIWEDTMAVVSDSQGRAARPPLNLPSKPLVLSQGGMCTVAVCADSGILIFDQMSSKLVQCIPFQVNGLTSRTEDQQQPDDYGLSHADTPTGSCVVLAAHRRIWVLRPVAPESQALQLLKSKSYSAALDLAEQCAGEGAPWVQVCFAQAGLLLIQELRWQLGVEALEKCNVDVFQPWELFPLFPEWTAKFMPERSPKEYWGLHTELTDIPTMVKRSAIRRQMSGDVSFTSNDSRGGAPQSVDSEPTTSGREFHATEAQQCIASFLLKIRGRNGVECLPGIDTLIVHLLAGTGDAGQLEDFLSKKQEVTVDHVRQFLLDMSRPHSLGLLLATAGDCAGALEVWRKIAAGELMEGQSISGATLQANGDGSKVAKYHAAKAMMDYRRVSDELVIHHLKWLQNFSPRRFIQVVKLRSLPIPSVLGILEGKPLGLRWRYLDHLISLNLTEEPDHHTEHALVLIDTVRQVQPSLDVDSAAIDDCVTTETSSLFFQTGSQRDTLQLSGRPSLDSDPELGEPPACYLSPDELSEPSVAELRVMLQAHLIKSKFYDAIRVLRVVEGTWLYEEQVILYCRLSDHPKALRVLAVTLRDINGAIRYCKKHAGHEGFLALLEMLLRPGEGREPMYTEACQVLNAESGNLDPMRVLEALSEDMPLDLAYATLARMLRERTHRKRQTRIVHQLYRSREVLSRAERYELRSTIKGRAVVETDSQCSLCHKLLGGRIFYRYPNRSLVCASCHRDMRERESTRIQTQN
ncbi:hypothetical protein BSKO_03081 [Bryopsis sp. KO-2023]|nr:hypothetical protein BSKO_03081 [Bryopsis sp. KO-2023]